MPGMYAQLDKESRKELKQIWEERRSRFRILVCIDGSEAAYEAIRYAAQIGKSKECDIVLLYVRTIDQGARSGGLQVNVARQNMLDWGLELPGIKYLKNGLDILKEFGQSPEDWKQRTAHRDVEGDPLGDNKVEYIHQNGKRIVLKLKTAPDVANGILDQYELGPYNLIILGEPSRWRGEFKSVFDSGVVQKVTMLSPCSVLVARKSFRKQGYFICTDGTEHSLDSAKRAAVMAQICRESITLFSVAKTRKDRSMAIENIEKLRFILDNIGIKVNNTEIGIGDPAIRIIDKGSKYSVIVVEDSKKSRLKRFFVGSVAFEVIRGAKNSVLNVR